MVFEYTTIFYLVLSHTCMNQRLAENSNCLKPLACSAYGEAKEESWWFSITYHPSIQAELHSPWSLALPQQLPGDKLWSGNPQTHTDLCKQQAWKKSDRYPFCTNTWCNWKLTEEKSQTLASITYNSQAPGWLLPTWLTLCEPLLNNPTGAS